MIFVGFLCFVNFSGEYYLSVLVVVVLRGVSLSCFVSPWRCVTCLCSWLSPLFTVCVCVCVLQSMYKLWDDKWKLSLQVKVAFAVAQAFIFGFGIASAFVFKAPATVAAVCRAHPKLLAGTAMGCLCSRFATSRLGGHASLCVRCAE